MALKNEIFFMEKWRSKKKKLEKKQVYSTLLHKNSCSKKECDQLKIKFYDFF